MLKPASLWHFSAGRVTSSGCHARDRSIGARSHWDWNTTWILGTAVVAWTGRDWLVLKASTKADTFEHTPGHRISIQFLMFCEKHVTCQWIEQGLQSLHKMPYLFNYLFNMLMARWVEWLRWTFTRFRLGALGSPPLCITRKQFVWFGNHENRLILFCAIVASVKYWSCCLTWGFSLTLQIDSWIFVIFLDDYGPQNPSRPWILPLRPQWWRSGTSVRRLSTGPRSLAIVQKVRQVLRRIFRVTWLPQDLRSADGWKQFEHVWTYYRCYKVSTASHSSASRKFQLQKLWFDPRAARQKFRDSTSHGFATRRWCGMCLASGLWLLDPTCERFVNYLEAHTSSCLCIQ